MNNRLGIAILWSLPALFLLYCPLLAEDIGDSDAKVQTLDVGSQKISVQFPANIHSIIRAPENHPTLLQGGRGNESVTIGRSDDFDTYSVRVLDPSILEKHGHGGTVTDLDHFIETEVDYYKKKFGSDIEVKSTMLPDALAAAGNADRYVVVTGGKGKAKVYLWRLILVNGQLVMAQREMGSGYVKANKIDTKNATEWDFLRSVSVSSSE